MILQGRRGRYCRFLVTTNGMRSQIVRAVVCVCSEGGCTCPMRMKRRRISDPRKRSRRCWSPALVTPSLRRASGSVKRDPNHLGSCLPDNFCMIHGVPLVLEEDLGIAPQCSNFWGMRQFEHHIERKDSAAYALPPILLHTGCFRPRYFRQLVHILITPPHLIAQRRNYLVPNDSPVLYYS